MGFSLLQRKLAAEIMALVILSGFAVTISIAGFSTIAHKGFAGTVYASPGVPISDAMVIAGGDEGYGFGTTNSSGQYTISEGLKTGNYTVSVFAEGYLQEQVENVSVTVGEITSGIDFYLNLSGAISGTVTDVDSDLPIANIMVTAFMPSNSSYGWMATTDVDGDYNIFTNLATGTYNVTVMFPEGYVQNETSGIAVTAGAATTGVDLTLKRSGTLSGRITASPSDTPLENANIYATSDDGKYVGMASSNATGYYTISSGLGTGNYTVMAQYELSMDMLSNVTIVAGEETSGIDFSLATIPPSPSGIITGKVTDLENNPIEGATVTAQGPGFAYAMTDENGEYIISNDLPTGNYTVSAEATGYLSENVTDVSVTEGEVTPNINFQLSPIPQEQSGTITGTMQGDENPIPEYSYPLAALMIATLTTIALVKAVKTRIKHKAAFFSK
jgi:hypothetical protein